MNIREGRAVHRALGFVAPKDFFQLTPLVAEVAQLGLQPAHLFAHFAVLLPGVVSAIAEHDEQSHQHHARRGRGAAPGSRATPAGCARLKLRSAGKAPRVAVFGSA